MTFVLSKLNHEDKEQISSLAKLAYKSTVIDSKYYEKYDVKRGLRDINGAGVLAGLTEISDIISFREENGAKVPTEGDPWKTVLPRIRCGRHRTRVDQGETFRFRRDRLSFAFRGVAR